MIIEISTFWESKKFSKDNGYGDTGRVQVYGFENDIVKTKSLTNPSRPHYNKKDFLETHRLLQVDLFGDVL